MVLGKNYWKLGCVECERKLEDVEGRREVYKGSQQACPGLLFTSNVRSVTTCLADGGQVEQVLADDPAGLCAATATYGARHCNLVKVRQLHRALRKPCWYDYREGCCESAGAMRGYGSLYIQVSACRLASVRLSHVVVLHCSSGVRRCLMQPGGCSAKAIAFTLLGRYNG